MIWKDWGMLIRKLMLKPAMFRILSAVWTTGLVGNFIDSITLHRDVGKHVFFCSRIDLLPFHQPSPVMVNVFENLTMAC